MIESSAPAAAENTTATEYAVLTAILLAGFVLYVPSLANDFTWDDRYAAMGDGPTRHRLVATLHPLGDYFGGNWWADHAPGSRLYRPLTTLWFALRHAAVGDHSTIAHLLNLVLHTAGVWLCHTLLRRLGLHFAAAAAGTALFALHALHSEAVANLVGAAELLALVFGLASAVLALRGAACANPRRFAVHYPLAALCLFAAAASKESGLTWAAMVPAAVVIAHWRAALGRVPTRADGLAIALAMLAPALVYLALRAQMIAHLPPDAAEPVDLLANPLVDLAALPRIASGVQAWAYGLWLTLFPFHLAVDYGPDQLPVVRQVVSSAGLLSLGLALAGLGAVAVAAHGAKRRPLLALAIAHFVATSVVTSHVPMPVFLHFGERTYTTPSLALAIAVAAVADTLRTPRARLVGGCALGAWLLASIATAWPRNFVWADDATLILHEAEHSPRSARMQLAAGELANRRGDTATARRHFERAAELAPDLPHAYLELAYLELQQHRLAAATALVERAEAVPAAERARHAARLRAARTALQAAAAPPPSPR